MRKWIALIENAQIDLDVLLRPFNNDKEVEEGTCGYCGTFALALHRFLKRQGIPSTPIMCVTNEYEDGTTEWSHWLVEAQGAYWDILGRVDPNRESFKEFYEIVRFDPSTEEQLLKEIAHNPALYSESLLARWTKMLEGANNLVEGMQDGKHLVYHGTYWGEEIIAEGFIAANTTLTIRDKTLRGVCVTRDMRFARQFAPIIFGLDWDKIKRRYRSYPRAERGAYDLANDHGDFRIEAEEFIVCPHLDLSQYLVGIWVNEEHVLDDDAITQHPLFRGRLKNI